MNEILENLIKELYSKIEAKDKEINTLKQSIARHEKTIDDNDKSFRRLNEKIDEYKKQIKDLEVKVMEEQDKRSKLTSYIISQDKNINTSSILSANTGTIWSSKN